MIHLSNLLSESRGWGQGELSILNLILLQDILLGEETGREILKTSSQVISKFIPFVGGKAGRGPTCTFVFTKGQLQKLQRTDKKIV